NPLKDYGLNIKSSDIPLNLSGLCGTISYAADTGSADRSKKYESAKLQGLQNMIIVLNPTAKQLISKIKLNDEGKRELNPDNYVVYKVVDKDGDHDQYLKDKGTIDQLTKLNEDSRANKDFGIFPAVSWPLGGDEVLSAAAVYQVALSFQQSGAGDALALDKQAKFEKAKESGWIAAGNYYRVLSTIQDEIKKEYDSYRLSGLNAKFGTDVSRYTGGSTYLTLFGQATVVDKNQKNPIATIDESYRDTLNNILAWINYSYPYAKLHGQVMTPALSNDVGWNVMTGQVMSGLTSLANALSQVLGFHVIVPVIVTGATTLVAFPPGGIAILAPIPLMFLAGDVVNVLLAWGVNMQMAANLDPIIRLQNVGDAMMNAAISYIAQITTFSVIINSAITSSSLGLTGVEFGFAGGSFMGVSLGIEGAIGSLVTLYNSLLSLAQTLVFMSFPVGLAIMGPMFVSGAVFAIYVPLIPLILFIFGGISWLISVLVLMAAAPIICFLMLWGTSSAGTGENPLLAKEAEQFVLQVVGVFFRPTLMIIGLIAGMVLSYIGIDLLNLGFSKIFTIVMQYPDEINAATITALAGQIIDAPGILFKIVGILVVYTFITIAVVNMCFSTIYLLYSEVMKAANISAPATGLEKEQLEGIKGGVTQAAEAGSGAAKDFGGSLKGGAMGYKGNIAGAGGGGSIISSAEGAADSAMPEMPGGGGGGGMPDMPGPGGGGGMPTPSAPPMTPDASELGDVAGVAGDLPV
ncbi:MAG: hypothetical protein KKE11_04755, partial [Gammaproteobacteria bacterium]|nr:hypothetical protein [Gammaproteobacteria bacterium]